MIKEKLKKYVWIVTVYESIWGGFKRRIKLIKGIINRTFHRLNAKCSYGNENRNKTFLLLTYDTPLVGIYSYIILKLSVLEWAEHRNYIPVFDLKSTYAELLQDREKEGLENAWEYYYKQPVPQYGLDDVHKSKNVIKYDEQIFRKLRFDEVTYPFSAEEINKWNYLINKYINLQDTIAERIKQFREERFAVEGKILAVSIRAGYRWGELTKKELYNNHSRVPDCEHIIQKVIMKMKEYDYQYIFLAVEDREYLESFKKVLGESCIYYERELYHYFKEGKPVVDLKIQEEEFKETTVKDRNEKYIIETNLLARCDSMYCTKSGAATFAILMNGGKYEHTDVCEEGSIRI